MLSALAAVTTRIELGTIVACTSFRNPALLAKMAVTLDEISGGRPILLGLALQLHFSVSDVSFSCGGLVSASPE